MKRNLYIPIDIGLDFTLPCLTLVKRGDTLSFTFKTFNKGILTSVAGQEVTLRIEKPDGKIVEAETTVNNSTVTASIGVQGTVLSGLIEGDLKITDSDGSISSNTFTFIVQDSVSSDILEKSQDVIASLDEVRGLVLKWNEQVELIGVNADAVEALNGIKNYIDNTLPTLQDETAWAKANLSNLDTKNSTASTNITNLINKIAIADDLLDKFRLYDPTSLIQQVQNNTASLSEITKFKLIADIDGTDYKTGQPIDYSYIRNRQEYLYGQFYRKLFTGLATQICCMGDSLTNGQDTTSSDARSVTADITRVSGEAMSGQTIASTTYPEALQANLQFIYGTQVKVINRGYSGDWVKNGYNHYPTKHSSDLTILMYGTNDSRASWVPDDIRGNLEQYINWYEQLIIREILWNKAVIILKPPKLQYDNDVNIKTFAIALDALGEKYSVPVIDSTEFTANYPSTIYCDSVHFNASGYKVFASKVTALFVGEGAKSPMLVSDGATILTRPNLDNLQYLGGSAFSHTGGAVQTPAETLVGEGVVAQWTGTGKGIIYSFYTEENDLMLIPFFYSSTGNLRLTLDFNTASPHNTDDLLVDYSASLTEVLSKQVVYNFSVTNPGMDIIKPTDDTSQPTIIRISEKGWHTLLIDTTDNSAAVNFNALHFMNYRNFKHERDILLNKKNITSMRSSSGFLEVYTHANYSSAPADVPTSIINISDINTAVGGILNSSEYYKNPAMKLTVINFDNSVIEYGFTIPQYNGATSGLFSWWQINKHNLIDTPTERTVSNMTLDRTNNQITITWGGIINKLTSFMIKPL